MKLSIKMFMAAIAAIGILRFVLTVAGAPHTTARYATMTVVIMLGALYFSINSSTHIERLKLAYLLIFPYMIVEVAALLYTRFTGTPTIFHAPEYSLGTTINQHTFDHLVGGLTWEPALVFLFMEAVWGVGFLVKKLGQAKT
jgi:hypothetical protein